MRVSLLLLTFGLALVTGAPKPGRIVGGSVTTIDKYPFAVAFLLSVSGSGTFIHYCGGSIINNRSVLSAAHCFEFFPANRWRLRVGSTYGSKGGVVHNIAQIITHPNYNNRTLDRDVAIVRVSSAFSFNNNVQAGRIASTTYNLPDNTEVWAIGWGATETGEYSEELRHVQFWTINRDICRIRNPSFDITNNMVCVGWLDVGGRDQCQGDSGGPLLHHNNIVGLSSFGLGCGDPLHPGVNAFVPPFTNWIVSNA